MKHPVGTVSLMNVRLYAYLTFCSISISYSRTNYQGTKKTMSDFTINWCMGLSIALIYIFRLKESSRSGITTYRLGPEEFVN